MPTATTPILGSPTKTASARWRPPAAPTNQPGAANRSPARTSWSVEHAGGWSMADAEVRFEDGSISRDARVGAIDAVYLWVDGSDPAHQATLARYRPAAPGVVP